MIEHGTGNVTGENILWRNMKNKNVYLVILLVAIAVILAAVIAAYFLAPKPDDVKSPVNQTLNVTATPMPLAVASPATITLSPTTLKVVVDRYGWVNNNNCTVHAVVENIGTENVSFKLAFNDVQWNEELLPKGRRSGEISLPFGNIGKGELMVRVRGDVNQINSTWCSESSSSGDHSLNTVSPTTTPTVTPPPEQIPEFPTVALPIVSVLILLFLFRKK